MTITAAADGSALGNPGPAGWAWYVNDDCWAAGGWKHATNNQGELRAVLELFQATAHRPDDLHVLCDSQYVINTVTKWMPGWKKKGWRKADGQPVMNLELIQELDDAIAGRHYRFEWVRGHIGHPLNEAADTRARGAAEAFQRGVEPDGGPGFPGAGSAPVVGSSSGLGSGLAGEAPRVSGATSKAVGRVPASSPEAPSLFSLDTPLSLDLSATELERLESRAASAGVSVEDFLRGLI
jgi:ribonuclease HI